MADQDRCACGLVSAPTRTGFGVVTIDEAVHAWAGCVTYRDRLDPAHDAARGPVEDVLRRVGEASR